MPPRLRLIVFGCLALAALPSSAQLRIANWNISNYSGSDRSTELKTAIYGTFEGRSMRPDVFICQEFLSSSAVSAFLTVLNTASGSPGDWAAAPFVNGPDTDSAFFYRTSKVEYIGMTVVSTGGTSPNQPRNIQRYDFRPLGYAGATSVIAAYGTHMKAQESGSDDEARRLLEAQKVRDNAQALPAGWNFLISGDFNINTSSEASYQKLVGSEANNTGRFFDPIATPGSWLNNSAFRFVHTQDPSGTAGMDDRFDQILTSASLVDGLALTYLGNPAIPYSTTTWDDVNHSFRAWGNDGTSFNAQLTITGNAMVGDVIAQAIVTACTPAGGHLPVFMDVKVPGKISANGVLNFGEVPMGSLAQETLSVSNVADTALWTANGISSLKYSLAAAGNVSAPAGNFFAAPGAAANSHTITLDTSTPGPKSGTITINSDDPDTPALQLSYVGTVGEQLLPESFSLSPGSVLSGDLASMYGSDDNRLAMRPGAVLVSTQAPLQMTVLTSTTNLSPTLLKFNIESSATITSLEQRVSLYDYTLPGYVEVDARTLSTSDATATITIPTGAARFVDQTSGELKVRVSYKALGAVLVYPWQAKVDFISWVLG